MIKTQINSLVLFLLATVSAFATTTEIGSARNLVRLTKCAKTDTVLITRDIDLKGESFSPLCEGGFKGVFDGQGHTISNLTISQNIYFTNNVAFIAKLDGGVLRNLSFDKPSINTTEWTDWNLFSASGVSVAVAVGELNGGVVENVHVVEGTVTINGKKRNDTIDAGGIVGTATSGTISESGGDIDVTNKGKGSVNVGGICGNITGDVTLTGVSYEGNASSLVGAGGNNVTIVNKYGAVMITEKGSTKSAVIDGNYTGSEIIDFSEDVKLSSLSLDREFTVGARSTIVLPFSIAVSKVHGATFYEFAQIDKVEGKWQVGIRKVQDGATLEANVPYILVASSTQLTFDVKTNSTVTLNTSTKNPVAIDSWTFAGTYGYLVVGGMADYGRVYGFSGEAKDGISVGTFVKGGAGATIKPMRAYLVYNDGGNSAGKTAGSVFGAGAFDLPEEMDVVVLDERASASEKGIMNVRTGVVRSGNWYDLQGRRLNSEPTVQGTYYHNGKRIIVK